MQNKFNNTLDKINIDKTIIKKLNANNIYLIKDLWKQKRKNLKQIGLNDKEIQHITIRLQLNSLDLNKKIYSKN